MRCPTFLKASLAVGLIFVSGLGVQTAQAQSWAPMATVSGTATLVTNSLCYTDGLDIVCNGTGPAAGGGGSTDRIVSSTTSAVIANQTGGTVSFTLGSTAGAAYLHPSMGLVASGVSTTGNISASTLLSSGRATFKGGVLFDQGFTGMNNLIYTGSNSPGAVNASMGFFVAGVGSSSAAQGPYFLGRGNTFNDLNNQRGSMLFVAGTVTSPHAYEGAIQFWTGSEVRRVIIDNLGNVGINTALSATTRLDVSGTLRVASGGEACDANRLGAVRFTAGEFSFCRVAATGWETLSSISGGGGTSDRIVSGTTGVYTYNNTSASIATAGVERFVIGTNGNIGIGQQPTAGVALSTSGTSYFNGNVGIGTSSPSATLTVSSSIGLDSYGPSAGFNIQRAFGTLGSPSAVTLGGALGVIGAKGYGTNQFPSLNTGAVVFFADETFTNTAMGTSIVFQTAGLGTTTRQERLRITADGNVGIGTSIPAASLTVSGTTYLGAVGNFTSGSAVAGNLMVYKSGGYAWPATTGSVDNAVISRLSAGGAAVDIGIENGGTAWLQSRAITDLSVNYFMVLNPNGAGVGIGVRSPSTTLHVSGTLRIASGAEACDANRIGAIRYQSGDFSYCRNGTTWETLTSLTGGGGSASDRIISGTTGVYTYNNTSASIATAGVERLVIGTTGNIGIGQQPNPSHTLAIAGTVLAGPSGSGKVALANGDATYTGFTDYQTSSSVSIGYVGYGTLNSVFPIMARANHALTLGANNAEAIRIVSTGNVGIGTTAPTEKLQINGNLMVNTFALGDGNGIFFRPGFTSTPSTTAYNLSITNRDWSSNNANSDGFLLSAYDGIGFQTLSGSYDSSKVRMFIQAQGNIGINTLSPSSSLHIVGGEVQTSTSGNACATTNSGAIRYTGGNLSFCNGTTWNTLTSSGGTVQDRIVSGTTGMYAYNSTSASIATAGVERLVIGTTGNVGIGQQPGVAPLSVLGQSGLIVTRGTDNAGWTGINAYSASGTLAASFHYGNPGASSFENQVIAGSRISVPFVLIASTTEAMRIMPNGNVGIGATAPGAPLHVATISSATDVPVAYLQSGAATSGFSKTTLKLFKGAPYGGEIAGYIDQSVGSGLTLSSMDGLGSREVMRITNAAQVGISTTAPSATLHVNGTLRIANGAEACDANRTGAIRYSGGDFSYCRNGTSWESLTSLTGGGGSASDRIISGTTGMYTYVNTKATIATAGVERMVINSTGEIGIAQQPLSGSAFTVSGSLRAARTSAGGTGSGGTIFANTQVDPTGADQRLGILAMGSIGTAGTHYPAAISAWSSEAYSNTNAGGYLAFETQNTATSALRLERMRIAPNGNVGIGLTAPSNTLHVNGAINIGTDATSCDANRLGAVRFTAGEFSFCRVAATGWETLASIASGGGSSTPDRIISGTTSMYAYNNTSASIATAGVERLVVGTTGEVGIGRQPLSGYALDVSGSTRTNQLVALSGGIWSGGNILFTSGAPGIYWPGNTESVRGNGTSKLLNFFTNGAERLRINSAGLVGIGTITPTTALEVSGTVSATQFVGDGSLLTGIASGTPDRIISGTLAQVIAQTAGTVQISATGTFINNGGTNDARLAIGTSAGGNRNSYIDLVGDTTYTDYGLRIIRQNIGPNSNSIIQHRGTGGLVLATQQAAPIVFTTSNTESMRILANGNVGMGISSPITYLDVSGTGNVARFGNGTTADQFIAIRDLNGGTYLGTTFNYSPGFGDAVLQGGTNKGIAFTVNSSTFAGIAPTMYIATNGRVGIGLTAPSNTLHVNGAINIGNDATSCDANRLGAMRFTAGEFSFCRVAATGWETLASIASGGGSSTPDRLVSSTSSLIAGSNGTFTVSSSVGTAMYLVGSGTSDQAIRIGATRSGNGNSYLELVGDATYSSFGLRIIRGNGGPNTSSTIQHRGTGPLVLQTVEAAPLVFQTTSAERMRILANGNVGIGVASPAESLVTAGSIHALGGSFYTSNSGVGMNVGAYPGILAGQIEAFNSSNPATKYPLLLNRYGGNVGVGGVDTPSTTLHVAGSIRLANGGEACDANRTGTMRYTGGVFQICDGTGYATILDTSATIPGVTTDRIVSNTSQIVAMSNGNMMISATGTYINQSAANDSALFLGRASTANRNAYIDFVGDTTYTSYGLRIIRGNTGPNTTSTITHRGIGSFILQTQDNAPLVFTTSGTESMRVLANGNVGIGLTAPTVPLQVSGTMRSTGLYVAGDITYTGDIYGTSDRRLKTAIAPISSSLAALSQLRPVSYQFRNKIGKTEYGFIAQEVQKLYPNLIGKAEGTSDTLTLNYVGLIAPMVRSIQEVDTRVNKLETENATLRAELDALRTEVRALAKQRQQGN